MLNAVSTKSSYSSIGLYREISASLLGVICSTQSAVSFYNIDIESVDYQTVKDYVDEIKNAGCDLENGFEQYSEEVGLIAFEGVLNNHNVKVFYFVEDNSFSITIYGE